MTIQQLIKQFTDTAKARNIPLYYDNEYGVDEDIFNWLPNAVVSEEKHQKGTWTSVDTTKGTTEKEMLKTAQKMCLSQAIQYFTAELEVGTFDALSTYRIIFLEETGTQGNSLELICDRYSAGKFRLYVNQVHPGRGWRGAGNAWLATNPEPFDLDTDTLKNLDTLTLERAIGICVMNGYKVSKE